MSEVVIRVENLGKRYKIGQRGTHADELRGRLASALTAPFRKLRGAGRSEKREPSEEVPSPHGGEAQGEGASASPLASSHSPLDNALWALRDVSFEVKRGEIVGIIGRNGAGKSTLLKILSRITEPTTGRVEMTGRLAALLEVGTGFHPELTGRENVYLNGSILGMTKAEIDREFDAIVDFAGVEKFIDTPVKRYSSGMHVRLGFAVAAHLQPEILIVDEVLAVGDAQFQDKCLSKLRDVSSSGRTVLFVSHNMKAIRGLCSRGIMIEHGSIGNDGLASECIRQYLAKSSRALSSTGERVWDDSSAPQSEFGRMHSVRLVQDDTISPVVDVSKTLHIVVTYRLYRRVQGLRTSIHLLTEDDTVVFASTDKAERPDCVMPGTYQAMCTVPENLLNERQYGLQVGVDVPFDQEIIPAASAIAFKAFSSNSRDDAHVSELWPGCIAPRLRWKVTRCQSDPSQFPTH